MYIKTKYMIKKGETVKCQAGTEFWYWYAYSVLVLEAGG